MWGRLSAIPAQDLQGRGHRLFTHASHQRHGLGGPEGARFEAPFEPQAIQQRGESDGGEPQGRAARRANRVAGGGAAARAPAPAAR